MPYTEREILDAVAADVWSRIVEAQADSGALVESLYHWEEYLVDVDDAASAFAEWLVGIEVPRAAHDEIAARTRRAHSDYGVKLDFADDLDYELEIEDDEDVAFDRVVEAWGEHLVYGHFEGPPNERLTRTEDAITEEAQSFMPDFLGLR